MATLNLDLSKIKDYYTREVFKQVIDALKDIDNTSKKQTATIINSGSSTTTTSGFNHFNKDVDSTDSGRGFVVIPHVPQLNSEHICLNGIHLAKGSNKDYTINNNVIYFNSPLVVGDRIVASYAF